jgi:VWFA-related protein
MKRTRFGMLLVWLILLEVAAAPHVLAQTSGPAQDAGQKPIRVDVNVTLKLIQVSVTDRQGKPVLDLAPADFEVTDNGKTVAITQFEKHRYGGSDAPLPSADAAPVLPRRFFLIFDFAFMDQNGMLKAKQTALHFLDTIARPGDEVGLVSYSPMKNLVLHEYLTTDHKKIRQIVEGFGLRSVSGRAESLVDIYLDQVRADTDFVRDSPALANIATEDRSLVDLLRARVQTSLGEGQRAGYLQQAIQFSRALKNLAQALRYVAGTKHILFFSNGIARQVLYGKKLDLTEVKDWVDLDYSALSVNAAEDSNPGAAVRDAYTEMLDEFKTSNCQIYSFNEARVRGEGDISDPMGTAVSIKDVSGEEALRQIASATSGRYYHNTMDFQKAMADVSSLTNAFYVLGYRVDEKWDGAYHKVKVKVARKGTSVQAQSGYYNLKPFDKLTAFEKMLQLMDFAIGETSPYSIPADIPLMAVPARAGMVNLFAGYAMLSAETFKAVLGKNAEAFVFIFDDKRNVVAIKRFLLPPPPADRDGLFLDFGLIVRPGAYQSRVVIRNPVSGRGAIGQVSFSVPDASAVGAWSDPLLLLEEGRNTLAVSVTGDLSLPKLYGYDSVKFFPRAGEVPTGVPNIAAAVRCGGFGDGQDLTLVASAVNAATQVRTPVSVKLVAKSQTGGANILRLDLGIGELAPGKYTLDVVVQSKSAGMSALASTPLKIGAGPS